MDRASTSQVPSYSSWQEAWDAAQSYLDSARESLKSSSTFPHPRISRVGQLDCELLDQELIHLLQEPLSKALALVNPSFKAHFEQELSLIIQLTLYKFSIWNTGTSYGAKLQDLKYTVSRSHSRSPTPSGLPRRTLLLHGALTILLPYLHSRLRVHALSRAWPDAPSSDRRRKAWDILTKLESAYAAVSLASFIAFMWDGRYRTIADRLLGMALVPSINLIKREVSYEFMNRQMVWHAFTEFLLFLLPLVNARSVRRNISRLSSKLSLSSLLPAPFTASSSKLELPQKRGKYWSLSSDQCAICAENAAFSLNFSDAADAFTSSIATPLPNAVDSDSVPTAPTDVAEEVPAYPIYTPYATSCGHAYCYHCIAERMMRAADEGIDQLGWECLRCGERVRGADRVEAEIRPSLGSVSDKGSDGMSDFSSEFDTTDVTGSLGDYSESFSD